MTPPIKTLSMQQLAEMLDAFRHDKRIVLCHGVFDLLHIGHIRYLRAAKRYGDILVVTLTPDRFVDKGPGRPAFTETLRAEMLASLDFVDYVAINEWPTAEETLKMLRPHVYVKGSEFRDVDSDPTGKIAKEAALAKELGIELVFTEDIVFSSSNLINRYLSDQSEETQEYMSLFRKRYMLDEITAHIDRMSALRVLVVGDVILDAYQYCDAMGKSSKDPILALKYRSEDCFAGGAIAISNHIAGFAKDVTLLSTIGDDGYEDFILGQLRANVKADLIVREGKPTTLKRRFIDGGTLNKLMEVYVMDDSFLREDLETEMIDRYKKLASECDLVVATDFGHGTISRAMIEVMAGNGKYLAVNTQANAGNRGFNTISKYPRADFAILAEHELRLEMRDDGSDIGSMLLRCAEKLGTSHFFVTRGRRGCAVVDDREFMQVPAFATNVVDRVGAGDAFFSVAAIGAYLKIPSEIIGFLGNLTGAMAVEFIGNAKYVDAMSLKKAATAAMK